MPLIYTYPDAYLAKFCTEPLEQRALEEVQLSAQTAGYTFSADWLRRLTIVKSYILACLENQADTDDLFTAKLKSYRAEYDALLPQALQAAAKAAQTPGGGGFGFFSVPLERS